MAARTPRLKTINIATDPSLEARIALCEPARRIASVTLGPDQDLRCQQSCLLRGLESLRLPETPLDTSPARH